MWCVPGEAVLPASICLISMTQLFSLPQPVVARPSVVWPRSITTPEPPPFQVELSYQLVAFGTECAP